MIELQTDLRTEHHCRTRRQSELYRLCKNLCRNVVLQRAIAPRYALFGLSHAGSRRIVGARHCRDDSEKRITSGVLAAVRAVAGHARGCSPPMEHERGA